MIFRKTASLVPELTKNQWMLKCWMLSRSEMFGAARQIRVDYWNKVGLLHLVWFTFQCVAIETKTVVQMNLMIIICYTFINIYKTVYVDLGIVRTGACREKKPILQLSWLDGIKRGSFIALASQQRTCKNSTSKYCLH